MAGTTVNKTQTTVPGSDLRAVVVAVNALIDDVETLRAAVDAIADKLDADAGVTDTDFADTADVATAATMTAAKIANPAGTVVTS